MGERRLAMTDPEDAELRAQLRTAEEVLACAVAEARLRPEVAAAACAVLAGEYAAVLVAGRQQPLGPVLDEVARVLRCAGRRSTARCGLRRPSRRRSATLATAAGRSGRVAGRVTTRRWASSTTATTGKGP